MFEIVFLGTSASAPSIQRGLPAQVVMHREHRFLIDCGEGTQRQILQSGLGFKRLDKILITHAHLDHILGLAGLLSTFARWETIERLEIWAGSAALARIRDLLFGVVLRGARPPMTIELCELEPGVVLEDEDFALHAFPVSHRGQGTFGFLFEEKPRRPFIVERAEALNVPAGPLRRELVAGRAVQVADGRTVQPEEVLGPLAAGTRLVHVGDCGRTEDLLEVCHLADGLVIEATYLEVEAEMARQFAHLTARQAARLAQEAGVRQLFLTHISRRYREREILDEAKEVFDNTTVARDFDHFQIVRSK
ncbi:MAG TPA: ribonuclease Z [Anaerolineales bacterium]|nr:ribonuclease Z [Anaerolineales bacterium]